MANYRSYSLQEKWLIINQIKETKNVRQKLKELEVPKSSYYDWLSYNLRTGSKAPHRVWNRAPRWVEQEVKKCRESGNPPKRKSSQNYGTFRRTRIFHH